MTVVIWGEGPAWEDRSVAESRMVKPPTHPVHPERVCWGCDKYCPMSDLACGNGTIRTPHPIELFGDDWLEWSDGNLAGPVTPQEVPHDRR